MNNRWIVNEIKKMNDGNLPKKVEILIESLQPVTPIVKKEVGFSFSSLQTLMAGDFNLSQDEMRELIINLSKTFYDFKMKKMRG